MGNPAIVSKTLASAVSTAVAGSQIPVSGTALSINGSLASNGTAVLDTARRVLLTFGNEVSGRSLNVVGTNQFGNQISETISATAGAAGTIATSQDFLTISALIPAGGGWTAAASVGTNTVGSTPWIFADQFVVPINIGFAVVLNGTVTYSVEYTMDNPNTVGLIAGVIPTAWAVTGFSVISSSSIGSLTAPMTGYRLTVNSGTGTATMTGVQPGIVASI